MHANVLGAMQTIPQVAPLVADAGGVFAFLSSSMSQIGGVPTAIVAVPHQQGGAQHGRGGGPATRRHAGHHRPRLGADRHGWWHGTMTVEGQRAACATPWPASPRLTKGRLLHHDGRRATHW